MSSSEQTAMAAALEKSLDGLVGEPLNKVTVKHVKKTVEKYVQAWVDKHLRITTRVDPVTGDVVIRTFWRGK